MHSFDRKLSALSNAVSGKVVRLIGRESFHLKARGDIFFESPCTYVGPIRDSQNWSRRRNSARVSEPVTAGDRRFHDEAAR